MELRRGIIKAFDPASYTATVQVAGSLANWLTGVPVAKHLAAGLLTSGSRCGVILLDPANPQDSCLAFVYEGTPGAWVSDGMLEGNITGSKVAQATTAARGTVELAEAGEATASLAVQANDPRLSDARTPTDHDHTKHTNRTRHIWLDANRFQTVYGSPAMTIFRASDVTSDGAPCWAFDPNALEGIGVTVVLPPDYAGGAITVSFYWASDADGNNTHGVRWIAIWRSIGQYASLQEPRYPNPALLDVTGYGASAAPQVLTITAMGSTVTEVVAGEVMRFTVYRNGTHGDDTLTSDALLVGVMIEYSADM